MNLKRGLKGIVAVFLFGLIIGCQGDVPTTKTNHNGFAGLGRDATGFAHVIPEREFRFPQDHLAHPDFRIEWWYITANLKDQTGQDWGIQWTLFRQATQANAGEDIGWQTPQLWLAHAALTNASQHLVAEKIARGGVGQAGVMAAPFKAWIDDWYLASQEGDFSPLRLTAHAQDFSYDLHLSTDSAWVLQGENGYSQKSNTGQASYYYSQPFFQVQGVVKVGGEQVEVEGQAWLDREWSSQPLASTQQGWDWFSLHLSNNDKLMLFQLRDDTTNYLSATYLFADGRSQKLTISQLKPVDFSTVAGRQIPTQWHIRSEAMALDIRVSALNPNAWMTTSIAYWEGPIKISGSHSGVGYLEMTGY